jgi:hypothetical protein
MGITTATMAVEDSISLSFSHVEIGLNSGRSVLSRLNGSLSFKSIFDSKGYKISGILLNAEAIVALFKAVQPKGKSK